MNLLSKPDFYRSVHRDCVSLHPLYGGDKGQRRNYVRVPTGTTGKVTFEITSGEDGTVSYQAKFLVGKRIVYVRCAPSMVELSSV